MTVFDRAKKPGVYVRLHLQHYASFELYSNLGQVTRLTHKFTGNQRGLAKYLKLGWELRVEETDIYRRRFGKEFPSRQKLSTKLRLGVAGTPHSLKLICFSSISTAMRPIASEC